MRMPPGAYLLSRIIWALAGQNTTIRTSPAESDGSDKLLEQSSIVCVWAPVPDYELSVIIYLGAWLQLRLCTSS